MSMSCLGRKSGPGFSVDGHCRRHKADVLCRGMPRGRGTDIESGCVWCRRDRERRMDFCNLLYLLLIYRTTWRDTPLGETITM